MMASYATCYDPLAQAIDDRPCHAVNDTAVPPQASMCCQSKGDVPDSCVSNGLCLSTVSNLTYRGSCTDQTWESFDCINLCMGNQTLSSLAYANDGSASSPEPVTACPVEAGKPQRYCCGVPAIGDECCRQNLGVYILADGAASNTMPNYNNTDVPLNSRVVTTTSPTLPQTITMAEPSEDNSSKFGDKIPLTSTTTEPPLTITTTGTPDDSPGNITTGALTLNSVSESTHSPSHSGSTVAISTPQYYADQINGASTQVATTIGGIIGGIVFVAFFVAVGVALYLRRKRWQRQQQSHLAETKLEPKTMGYAMSQASSKPMFSRSRSIKPFRQDWFYSRFSASTDARSSTLA